MMRGIALLGFLMLKVATLPLLYGAENDTEISSASSPHLKTSAFTSILSESSLETQHRLDALSEYAQQQGSRSGTPVGLYESQGLYLIQAWVIKDWDHLAYADKLQRLNDMLDEMESSDYNAYLELDPVAMWIMKTMNDDPSIMQKIHATYVRFFDHPTCSIYARKALFCRLTQEERRVRQECFVRFCEQNVHSYHDVDGLFIGDHWSEDESKSLVDLLDASTRQRMAIALFRNTALWEEAASDLNRVNADLCHGSDSEAEDDESHADVMETSQSIDSLVAFFTYLPFKEQVSLGVPLLQSIPVSTYDSGLAQALLKEHAEAPFLCMGFEVQKRWLLPRFHRCDDVVSLIGEWITPIKIEEVYDYVASMQFRWFVLDRSDKMLYQRWAKQDPCHRLLLAEIRQARQMERLKDQKICTTLFKPGSCVVS